MLEEPLSDVRELEQVYGRPFTDLSAAGWKKMLEDLLGRAKKEGGTPDIILLTGGASRMDFVIPTCELVFGKGGKPKIIRGPEPEYSIAAGLAYWGRVDIRSKGFVEEVERKLDVTLAPAIEKKLLELHGDLADDLTSAVLNDVVKPKFKNWVETRDSAAVLKRTLTEATQHWGKSAEVRKSRERRAR